MPKTKKQQQDREERIHMEIVVDAHDSEERSLGWYYYLDDVLQFPFAAKCRSRRSMSPLKVGDVVEVIEMPLEGDCEKEMLVTIRFDGDTLAVALAQLDPVDADEETHQAVEDWHYWVEMGYEF